MDSLLRQFVGAGTELTVLQMSVRSAAVFVIALLLLRVSGRRSFGQHSPFDSCTTVLLGAVLSRAVVGASPFWPTVAAAAALVAMHRLIGHACVRWSWFETFVSGSERVLVNDGNRDATQMRKALITESDLQEALRKQMGDHSLADVRQVILERNGDLTIVGQR
jgi:uncharacterized membrane protein YcaP (DUF421 family)